MTSTDPLQPLRIATQKAEFYSHRRDFLIRQAHTDGSSIRAIAAAVGISAARVHQIIHGR